MFSPNMGAPVAGSAAATVPVGNPAGGASFSTNSTSTSPMISDDDEDDYDLEGEPNTGSSRKRKRATASKGVASSSTRRMMDFFEGLMKQVMQKQEAMQQRFLEVVEKREQDRMIREEAWKRQEMARLTREHELMAQERAIAASRDAAIISFLQKITGQTIQLPQQINIPAVPPPPQAPAPSASAPTPPPPQPPPPAQQQQQQQQQQTQQIVHHHQHQSQNTEVVRHQASISSDVVMAVPEQQVPPQDLSGGGGGSGSFEPTSSRWPKTEVLALINLRSGLETRYQEAGPKGPLWEEISAGMQQMGYKRSSKRCKEKWENINKYFKKVKESNKKRPEDAKTCPYFHQLDALYRRKTMTSGSGGSSGSFGNQNALEQQQQDPVSVSATPPTVAPQQQPGEPQNKNGGRTEAQASSVAMAANLFGEASTGTGGAPKKPEDIMMEQRQQQLMVDDYDKIEEVDSDNIEDDEDDEDEDDEELEEERKMDYKIEFQQRQNTGPSNGGGNGAPSFLAMVQ